MKKSSFRNLGAAAAVLALALALVLSSCGGNDNNNGGSGGSLGATFTLSGVQVYTATQDNFLSGPTYTKDTSTADVTTYPSVGTGAITNGLLTITIGTPAAADLQALTATSMNVGSGYTVTMEPASGVNFANLSLMAGTRPLSKTKEDGTIDIQAGKVSQKQEGVNYVYVDLDVKVNLKGQTATQSGITMSYKSSTLNLKAGWNVINMEYSVNGTFSGSLDSASGSGSVSIKTGDKSSTYWVLSEDYSY
jgi:hypothetical protein